MTCGSGSKLRTREILHFEKYGGEPCNEQDSNQTMDCFPVECPVPCMWAEWSNWGSCSVSCGSGSRLRTR